MINRKICLVLAMLVLPYTPMFLVSEAEAGGLYVLEFGTPSMATAGVGANATASDASTAFHNPAGMTRLEGNQFMLAGGLLYADVRFDADPSTPVAGGDGGNAGGPAPILSAHYVRKINNDLSLGLANYTLSAALLDYDDDWAGRFQATEVTVLTTNFLASAGYQLTPEFSLGAGVAYMYAKVDQSLAVPAPGPGDGELNIDVDGGDVGAMLSFLWEPAEGTRLGATYATKLEPDLSGDVSVSPFGLSAAASVDLVFPETLRFSIYQQLDSRWALLASVNWEKWSDFESLDLTTNAGTVALPRNWRDIYSYGLGFHYQWSEDTTLKGGISYTESPVSAADRTADMPIDRQIRLATGFEKVLDNKRTLGFALELIDLGDARIDNATLKGEYENNYMIAVAVSMNWK